MRTILVDGDPIYRMGLRALLASREGLATVSGEANDARSGLWLFDEIRPDLVIMSVVLPGMSGIAATRELRVRNPKARILLIALGPREREAREALLAGAGGFFHRGEPVEALLRAVELVGRGDLYVDPDLTGIDDAVRKTGRGQAEGSASIWTCSLLANARCSNW
jgi:DNA-binding NarL/FixJ family response regulator